MATEIAINGALLEAFRHNAWGNRELLQFCEHLSVDHLAASGTGTYGGILDTFNHIVVSDARYLRRLGGVETSWVDDDDSVELAELLQRVDETEKGWEQLLSEPVDAERIIILDQGAYQAYAGVLVAQALHHGNVHREQICSILTGLGVEPPDLQPWAYADATGRGGPRNADG